MRILVLVIDRLHLGYLGCYGNAWVGTQHIDHLASQSFLFDQAIADTTSLPLLYRSYWLGRHALCPSTAREDRTSASLAAALRESGMTATLVSDEAAILSHSLAADFDEIVRIDTPAVSQAAREIEETALAQFFAAAIDTVQASAPNSFVWVHARGLAGPWDAPSALREQFADEDDPTPADFVEPPQLELPADFDPDLLLGIRQAYAGQIAVLDTCIGALVDAVDALEDAGQPTALAVLSARGQALGEHRQIGAWDHELHADTIHVPWLLRMPDRCGGMIRSSALVQPADWYPTILALAGLPHAETQSPVQPRSLLPIVSGDVELLRDRAAAAAGARRALRTPAWSLLWDAKDGTPPRLYVQPDDRWEVNEVSDRCLDIPDRLIAASREFEAACDADSAVELSALDVELAEGLA